MSSKGISMTIFGSALMLFSSTLNLDGGEPLFLGIKFLFFLVGASLAVAGISESK